MTKTQPKLRKQFREIIAGYGCPDSYLDNEVKKFLKLFKTKMKRIIGEKEKTTQEEKFSSDHRAGYKRLRNQLKEEQLKRLEEEVG